MTEQVELIQPASLHDNEVEKDLDLAINLSLQRFYDRVEEKKNKRISISLYDSDEPELVSMHAMEEQPKLSTAAILNDRNIQKTAWASDPLRLCLIDNNAPSSHIKLKTEEGRAGEESLYLSPSSMNVSQQVKLPNDLKMKSAQASEQHLSRLDGEIGQSQPGAVSDHAEVRFATAADTAPTPPPKLVIKTSLSLLPIEHCAPFSAVEPWFYSREGDLSMSTTTSPTTASVFLFDEEDNKEFTQETWEAIFHPLSTFRHRKGEIEYYAWNPANLPQAAARVAQRVVHARTHDEDLLLPSDVTVEATLPQVMSTPPPLLSPELEISSATEYKRHEDKDTFVVAEEAGHYYNMLQEIRGGHRYSHGSSIESQLYTESQEDGLSIKSETSKDQGQRDKSDVPKQKQGLIARISSANSLPALLLGKTPNNHRNEKKVQEPMDPETLQLQEQRYWTEKRLFWVGFVCPLLWYYGSFQSTEFSRINDPNDLLWRKRCRMAALYFSIVMSVVILVVSVKAAGAAGVRQAQSNTIRAVIAN